MAKVYRTYKDFSEMSDSEIENAIDDGLEGSTLTNIDKICQMVGDMPYCTDDPFALTLAKLIKPFIPLLQYIDGSTMETMRFILADRERALQREETNECPTEL